METKEPKKCKNCGSTDRVWYEGYCQNCYGEIYKQRQAKIKEEQHKKYIENHTIKNHDIEEIKNEQKELINILVNLRNEKERLKKSYYIYQVYNIGICLFFLIVMSCVEVVPYILFRNILVIAHILSVIFLFIFIDIMGKISVSSIFKGTDLIENYKNINEKIPYYEKKLNEMNSYLEKNKIKFSI